MKKKKIKDKLVRRIKITKGFGVYDVGERLTEFPRKKGVFYSERSPRFKKQTYSDEIKIISLFDLKGYIEDRIEFLDPIMNSRSKLNSYYRDLSRAKTFFKTFFDSPEHKDMLTKTFKAMRERYKQWEEPQPLVINGEVVTFNFDDPESKTEPVSDTKVDIQKPKRKRKTSPVKIIY